jgi:hypothetical protein
MLPTRLCSATGPYLWLLTCIDWLPRMHADCPVWDHVVQLFACCQPPGAVAPPACKPCQTTPWLAGGRNGGRDGPPADTHRRDRGGGLTATGSDELCGPELGRWITPFRCLRTLLERQRLLDLHPDTGTTPTPTKTRP